MELNDQLTIKVDTWVDLNLKNSKLKNLKEHAINPEKVNYQKNTIPEKR